MRKTATANLCAEASSLSSRKNRQEQETASIRTSIYTLFYSARLINTVVELSISSYIYTHSRLHKSQYIQQSLLYIHSQHIHIIFILKRLIISCIEHILSSSPSFVVAVVYLMMMIRRTTILYYIYTSSAARLYICLLNPIQSNPIHTYMQIFKRSSNYD